MKYILAVTFLLISFAAFAETSLNVPTNDPVYDQIEKLDASGLITSPIFGHRPWTRAYVRKLLEEALANAHKLEDNLLEATGSDEFSRRLGHKRFIEAILQKLVAEFDVQCPFVERWNGETMKSWNDETLERSDMELHPLSSISTTYTYLRESSSPIPANGLGGISATVHPLVSNRSGRQYDSGQNFYLETEHSAQITRHFAAYARPQFQLRFSSTAGGDFDTAHAYIQSLYAKTGWKNVELEIGRDEILWGNGLHGGLIFSDNARGLDMAKISTPYPLMLPWPMKIEAIAVSMGPEYEPDKAWLFGGRISLSPLKLWNFGFNYVAKNRKGSVDTKLTLKKLRGTSVYGEWLFDDDSNTRSTFSSGFFVPRLDRTGKWSLRLEYQRIDKHIYRSNKYTTGWTLNRLLLGNITGPDSHIATTQIGYYFSPSIKVSATGNYMRYDGNDHISNIYKLTTPLKKNRLYLHTSFGWDTAQNKKADLMGEVGLTMKFSEF